MNSQRASPDPQEKNTSCYDTIDRESTRKSRGPALAAAMRMQEGPFKNPHRILILTYSRARDRHIDRYPIVFKHLVCDKTTREWLRTAFFAIKKATDKKGCVKRSMEAPSRRGISIAPQRSGGAGLGE